MENLSSEKVIIPNTFGTETTENNIDKTTEIMGLIQNEIYILEEDLYIAQVEYSKSHRKDPFGCEFAKQSHKCDVLEAKINILEKVKKDLETMFPTLAIAN